MPQGFKFELKASRYSTGSRVIEGPFEITLREGDPRIAFYREAGGAFKETSVVVGEDFLIDGEEPKEPKKPTPPPPPPPPAKMLSADGNTSVDLLAESFKAEVIESLKENKFETIEKILAVEKPEDLKCKFVGESTAVKLIEACKGFAKP